MRSVTKYYFPAIVVFAFGVYILQHYNIKLPKIINNYLNDFLLLPMVLKICQSLLRYVKSHQYLKLPYTFCFFIALTYSIFFEIMVPEYSIRYTADFWDVIAYFLGLLFFFLIEGYISSSSSRSYFY